MDLATLAEHTGVIGGIAVTIILGIRFASDAVLRLVAGITAIVARDKRPRAERALEVLKTLRRDGRSGPGLSP